MDQQPCLVEQGRERHGNGRRRVRFSVEEIRWFRRLQGGSLSVPRRGSYALGLSWEVVKETKRDIPAREAGLSSPAVLLHHGKRKKREPRVYPDPGKRRELPRLKQSVRSRLLEASGGIWDDEEAEALQNVRDSRRCVGCQCAPRGPERECCGTAECECFEAGIQCQQDLCNCLVNLTVFDTRVLCKNPKSYYSYDPRRITETRRKTLVRVQRTKGN